MNELATMLVKILMILLKSREVISFNILAIKSIPLISHNLAFQPFFRELSMRGHNVKVMNNFPDKNSPSNLKFADLQAQGGPPKRFLHSYDSNYLHMWNVYDFFFFKAKEITLD